MTEVDNGANRIIRTDEILLSSGDNERLKDALDTQRFDASNKKESEAFTSRSLIDEDHASIPVRPADVIVRKNKVYEQ